jgi:hypothetical protein
LQAYESSRHPILEREEKTWRLKSRAIWIKQGDNNTKFFHQFATYRKNANTIWEIRASDDSMVRSFKANAKEGVRHFKSLFQEPDGCPIQEILEVISKFRPVFTKEMNRSMVEEVSEPKLHATLSSMQKGKRPRPDGLTVEFFLGFYDLLKEDLLKVVREFQRTRKVLGSFNSTFITLILKKQDGVTFGDYQ